MIQIGVKELREELGRYLNQVRRGETIHITRYGKRIARLSPDKPEMTGELKKLLDHQNINWNGQKPRGASRPVTLKGSPASGAVIEDRR
jgi:prevent-host-death family protein